MDEAGKVIGAIAAIPFKAIWIIGVVLLLALYTIILGAIVVFQLLGYIIAGMFNAPARTPATIRIAK